jgi:hypothetical protein
MSSLGQQVDAAIRAANFEIEMLDGLAAWASAVDDDDDNWRSVEISFFQGHWDIVLFSAHNKTVNVKRKRRPVALARALEMTKGLS